MGSTWLCVYFVFLVSVHVNNGLEFPKQQRTSNKKDSTDFLNHESGDNFGGSKRDYVAPIQPWNNRPNSDISISQTSSDYNSQFPALGRSSTNQFTSTPISDKQQVGLSGPQTHSPNGKRDYVAPQYPTLKPNQQSSSQVKDKQEAGGLSGPQSQSLNGKRDYVAPQYPTLKPTQPSSSKVKDLVNFYENNDKTTAKPWSFSSIVAGSTKPGIQPTTNKPSSPLINTPVISTSTASTSRPSTLLPSEILNKNKNQVNRNSGNGTTDAELLLISEELLKKDTNNAAKYITINFQGKTSGSNKEDHAHQPLLTIPQNVWKISTIQKFLPLLDNYVRDTLVNEHVTPQERNEENAFLDEIMTTNVIRHLMNFLKDKGYVSRDPKQQRDFLKQLWFSFYSRGKGKLGSSSFEHIFVSELKNNQVSGLHNWIYFSKEETANRMNYLGYLKHVELNDGKGAVMSMHFNQQGVDKPVDSMFVGTSPEFEMAVYTLCFITRPDNECKLNISSRDVQIVSHTFRYRSKNYIGSAYPNI